MPGLIPPATLEQIRAASDIVEVIGSYFPLKRAGTNFTALCPFHREKTPSFNVNPSKQIFHCFGCHKGGDVFTFVREYEHLTFIEAVRRLAERANIVLELEDVPGQRETRHVKDALREIHEQLTQRWHAVLLNDAAGQAARDYLAKRGVSEEAVKRFRLGAAPDAWDDTVHWARSKGHELTLVGQGGLILQREGGDGWYDRFRGRLIFPINDEQGRVIGFSGRILGDAKTAKYVNSPETPLFTKGRVIYGLDKAKRAMLEAGFAIVCEGQLDLIACHLAGIENVVAPQGTALTAEHARILNRYVQEVVLCFDSDDAGQNAATRSLDALLGAGLAIRVATVPAPHDPDSLIREQGAGAFRQLIGKAEGFFEFHLHRLCAQEDIATDRGRKAVMAGMADALLKSGDLVLRETHARRTAARLGVSPEAVLAEMKKVKAPRAPATDEEPDAVESEPVSRPQNHELQLLKILLTHDELAEWTEAHLDPGWIGHAGARQIVAATLAAHREGTWRGVPTLLDTLAGADTRGLITEAVSDPRKIPQPRQQLHDIAKRLRDEEIDRRIGLLNQRFADPKTTEEEKLSALQEQQALRSEKRGPLQPRTEPAD
jgi:DNA primase